MTVVLAMPDVRFHRSFLAARFSPPDEFGAAGEAGHDGVLSWRAESHFPAVDV